MIDGDFNEPVLDVTFMIREFRPGAQLQIYKYLLLVVNNKSWLNEMGLVVKNWVLDLI